MSNLFWLVSGGFAAGYRTYILSGLGVVVAGAAYATGDIGVADLVKDVSLALSVSTAKAGLQAAMDALLKAKP